MPAQPAFDFTTLSTVNRFEQGTIDKPGGKKKAKVVVCYTHQGEYVQSFDSIVKAATAFNVSRFTIGRHCDGERHLLAGKHKFFWLEDLCDEAREAIPMPAQPAFDFSSLSTVNRFEQGTIAKRGGNKAKSVVCYTHESEYVQSFDSAAEAATAFNVHHTTIRRHCNGEQHLLEGKHKLFWLDDLCDEAREAIRGVRREDRQRGRTA